METCSAVTGINYRFPIEVVDVCFGCVSYFDEDVNTDVLHPPYEDDHYTCFLCGTPLEEADYGYT